MPLYPSNKKKVFIGPRGTKGEDGSDGSMGANGPNNITTSTTTDITGFLKGNGANVSGDATSYAPLVGSSDIEINNTLKGVILTAPDASRWRITINNLGVLITTKL